MMLAIVLLFILGVALEGLFSGSESGFYRVSRIRLVIDAVGGSRVARGLLWLIANPSLFVATTQVGNNLANQLISLAMVLAAGQLFPRGGLAAELILPLVLTPLIFVYGELLPKSLFLQSPGRLLRFTGPVFLVCTVLFLPATAALWAVGRLLQWLLGESPEVVQRQLAREEIKSVLEEGHEAGILRPAQRAMAQGLFAVAKATVRNSMTPAGRTVTIREGTSKEDVLRLARRFHLTAIPVVSATPQAKPLGYVRVVDLYLDERSNVGPVRPMLAIHESEPHVTALVRMQGSNAPIARVVDNADRTLGYVSLQQLREPVLSGVTA
ncbi:MAG: CNNM domain-containing protein [Planctomycetes bacterium]|nr:CNNM domain-containing protein [Planctomycetota bacterium]